MKILPTTELLSAVLGTPITHVQPEDSGYLALFQNGETTCYKTINIYELMYLMKEWAWSQKYLLESGVTDTPFCSITNTNEEDTYNNYLPDERAIADTEPEAVTQACLWILATKT